MPVMKPKPGFTIIRKPSQAERMDALDKMGELARQFAATAKDQGLSEKDIEDLINAP